MKLNKFQISFSCNSYNLLDEAFYESVNDTGSFLYWNATTNIILNHLRASKLFDFAYHYYY